MKSVRNNGSQFGLDTSLDSGYCDSVEKNSTKKTRNGNLTNSSKNYFDGSLNLRYFFSLGEVTFVEDANCSGLECCHIANNGPPLSKDEKSNAEKRDPLFNPKFVEIPESNFIPDDCVIHQPLLTELKAFDHNYECDFGSVADSKENFFGNGKNSARWALKIAKNKSKLSVRQRGKQVFVSF